MLSSKQPQSGLNTRPRASLSILDWISIIAVLWLAAGLRFARLDHVPAALSVDEALNGYEAYSLLRTGHDEWGNAWPVTIRGFNDYRRPAIVYSAIPFIAIFGLTTFGIRATTATWGLLNILLTYRLARDMFGRWAGSLAGLILALLPWHVHFSRIGFETTVAMFMVTLGLWCIWRWFQSRRQAWLIGAGVAFGLSFYTYTTLQAFTPLIMAACGLIFARRLWAQKRAAALAVVIVALLAAPLAYSLASNPQNWNRLGTVSLMRPGEPLQATLIRLARQWLGHFSPDYLFIHGDAHPVLHPPGSGQLFAVNALLLPLGIWGISQAKKQRRAGALLVAWIALGAVPAALTIQEMGTPHSMRGMLGLPAYAILSAAGFMAVWNMRRIGMRCIGMRRIGMRVRMALVGMLAGLLAWNATTFLRNYFIVYPVQSARAFEYGVKEAVDYITAHQDEYDTIVLTNWISQPHIFVLFFQRYDPRRFQAEHPTYSQGLSAKLERWDKYLAGDVDKLYPQLEHGVFVARPHMLPGVKPTLTIYHPDGSPAFNIFTK